MDSRTVMFLGVVISLLFLYLGIYAFSDSPNQKVEKVSKVGSISSEAEAIVENSLEPETKKDVAVEDTSTKVEEVVVATETIDKAPVKEEIKTESEPVVVEKTATKKISIPAFGFMAAEKNQIIALMSSGDRDGYLAKNIDVICQSHSCTKDLKYDDEVMDAKWQAEAVNIINLMLNGGIKKGSLFIENNTVKIEGAIQNKKTKDRLNSVLMVLKSDNIKVEDKTTFDQKSIATKEKTTTPVQTPAPAVAVQTPAPKEERIQSSTPPSIEIDKTEEKVVKAKQQLEQNQTIEAVAETKEETKTVAEIVDENTKEEAKVVAKTTETVPVPKPVMETTLDTEPKKTESKNIVSSSSSSSNIQKDIDKLIEQNPIYFGSSNSTITKEGQETLNSIAKLINDTKASRVEIIGYADSSGDKIYNLVLSQTRADAVMLYLKNITSTTIKSIGKGDINPIGGSKNRVLIKIVDKEGEN